MGDRHAVLREPGLALDHPPTLDLEGCKLVLRNRQRFFENAHRPFHAPAIRESDAEGTATSGRFVDSQDKSATIFRWLDRRQTGRTSRLSLIHI